MRNLLSTFNNIRKERIREALEICVLKQLYPKKETECDNLHCSAADIEGTVG